MNLTKPGARQLSDTESRLLNLGIGIKIEAKYAGRLSAWYSIARLGYAENTIKNAVSDWKFFEDWCSLEKFPALPTTPAILVKFVDYVIGLKSPATIKRYIWTIGKYHQVANAGHPTLDGDFVECCRVIGRGLSKEQKERILNKHPHLAEPIYDENGDVLKENRIHHNLAKKQKQAEGLTWREMLKVQQLLLVEPLVEVSATSQKKEDKSKRRLNGISMRNQRDKVICMMGYDTLRRVSELCTYRFEDIEFDEKDGHGIVSSYQGKTNQEGAKFWLHVLTELQNRGLKDILIACVDGLKGFPEAINNAYPQTHIQLCIVHMMRHSMKYVTWQNRKEVTADLKRIYQSVTEEEALLSLDDFAEKWDNKYPQISRSWQSNWHNLNTFFGYPQDIRKVIYTTNAIESLNSVIRKSIKKGKLFPTDDSARKVVYLAMMEASKKWTMPIRNWKLALNRFTIEFEERLTDYV